MKHRILCIVIVLSLCASIIGAFFLSQVQVAEKSTRYHQHLQASEKELCQHDDTTFCTHLPLINIDTSGAEIPGARYHGENGTIYETTTPSGESFVLANIQIFDSSTQNNHLTDRASDVGNAQIKVRGNSSRYHDKLGYSLTFVDEQGANESHAVMGMDPHHEWAMHGPFMDKTLIRNYMWYNIAGEIMSYAPNVRFCEAFLNGEYIGVYVMVETITAGQTDNSRLDLSLEKKNQNFMGYCVRLDRGSSELKELNTFSMYTLRHKQKLDIVYPGTSNLSATLKRQIEQDFSYFERILYSYDYKSQEYGYTNYIDTQSFIDYFIINEFTSNYDAGWLSTYVYKGMDGLFRMCIWDFNSACDNYKDPINPVGFEMNVQPWYTMLIKCSDFTEQIIDRYKELRQTYLSDEYLNEYINSTVAYLGDAIDRNYQKWGYTFGEDEDMLRPSDRNPRTYTQAIEDMKNYLRIRSTWLDENIDSLMQYASDSRNKKHNEARR